MSLLRTPYLDRVLQVRRHQCRVEGQDCLPRPAFDAVQDTVGFLGCKGTLLAHVQHPFHQYPKVLYGRAVLNPFIPQLGLIQGILRTQVQDLTFSFAEPHEVLLSP